MSKIAEAVEELVDAVVKRAEARVLAAEGKSTLDGVRAQFQNGNDMNLLARKLAKALILVSIVEVNEVVESEVLRELMDTV